MQPDVHLVGTLVSLNQVMPGDDQGDRARRWCARSSTRSSGGSPTRTRAAVTGALNRAARTRRPQLRDIDWNRTIAANLKHYLPEHRTVVPERLVGYGRSASSASPSDVILAIDQSGSMAASVVYASVFGAVLASMRSVRTSLVVFDTAVVDLTDKLDRPGRRAVRHASSAAAPTSTARSPTARGWSPGRPTPIFVLISDLFEGGVARRDAGRVAQLRAAGVTSWSLLALSDEGAPAYDHEHAGRRPGRARACPPSRARRTRSPSCWPSPSNAATTWARGCRAPSSRSGTGRTPSRPLARRRAGARRSPFSGRAKPGTRPLASVTLCG